MFRSGMVASPRPEVADVKDMMSDGSGRRRRSNK